PAPLMPSVWPARASFAKPNSATGTKQIPKSSRRLMPLLQPEFPLPDSFCYRDGLHATSTKYQVEARGAYDRRHIHLVEGDDLPLLRGFGLVQPGPVARSSTLQPAVARPEQYAGRELVDLVWLPAAGIRRDCPLVGPRPPGGCRLLDGGSGAGAVRTARQAHGDVVAAVVRELRRRLDAAPWRELGIVHDHRRRAGPSRVAAVQALLEQAAAAAPDEPCDPFPVHEQGLVAVRCVRIAAPVGNAFVV